MQTKKMKSNGLKTQSGIRAGLWLTVGAGLGDLQIVPPQEKKPTMPVPVASTQPATPVT